MAIFPPPKFELRNTGPLKEFSSWPYWYVCLRCLGCQEFMAVGRPKVSSACLICREASLRWAVLLANRDFLSLLGAVRERPDDYSPRGVLADWLDEHEQGELADLFRQTCPQEAAG